MSDRTALEKALEDHDEREHSQRSENGRETYKLGDTGAYLEVMPTDGQFTATINFEPYEDLSETGRDPADALSARFAQNRELVESFGTRYVAPTIPTQETPGSAIFAGVSADISYEEAEEVVESLTGAGHDLHQQYTLPMPLLK